MTDRAKGCVVTFTNDIRTDDVEAIVNAIMMVKGVLAVDLNVATIDDHMNRTRVRIELEQKIFAALRGMKKVPKLHEP